LGGQLEPHSCPLKVKGVALENSTFSLGVSSGLLAALLYAALTFFGKKISETSPVVVSFTQVGSRFAVALYPTRCSV
jgi:hypothetical protein